MDQVSKGNVFKLHEVSILFHCKKIQTNQEFLSCFGKGEMQNEGNKQSSFCTNARQICKKKIDPKVLLPSDIKESVFNSLGDVE